MIFHENCLLADNFHDISYLISSENQEKMLQNLSSAAVVIGVLRKKTSDIVIGPFRQSLLTHNAIPSFIFDRVCSFLTQRLPMRSR